MPRWSIERVLETFVDNSLTAYLFISRFEISKCHEIGLTILLKAAKRLSKKL